jgi:Zn-dependent M28 family amino/carboxypeptidase
MLYLNLDMVGSPSFTRLVYAGDGDHVPPGSKVVEQHLIDYFRTQGLAVDLLEPGEGSDHAAFADAGIPVGGLFTGTDPCYHQASDDLTNIDPVASTTWRSRRRCRDALRPGSGGAGPSEGQRLGDRYGYLH